MKKTLNNILSTIFRSTMLVALLVCAQTVWGQTFSSSGTWEGKGDETKPDITGNETVSLTGDVSLTNYITIAKGASLTIINESGKDITIKNTYSGDGNGAGTNVIHSLFRVMRTGKLTIEGRKGKIIIDGGAKLTFPSNFPSNSTLTEQSGHRKINDGALETAGYLTLRNVILENMDMKTSGGAAIKIYPDKAANAGEMGITTVENCTIRYCRSPKGPALFGTGFYHATNKTGASCAINLTNVLIEKCYAKGDGSWAGIIRFSGGARSDLNMKDCTMRYNYAVNGCAGLFWNAGGKKEMSQLPVCTVDGCDFHDNITAQEGGAIRIETNMQFVNHVTKVHDNKAATLGGGIHIYGYNGGKDKVTGTEYTYELSEYLEIYENTAGEYGGGIGFQFTEDADLITGCKVNVNFNGVKIFDNKVLNEGPGGGLYFTNTTNTTTQNYDIHINLNKGLIQNNTAGNGGGIYIDKANINSSDDKENTLTVSNNKSTSVGAEKDNFTGGGGLYLKQGNIVLNTVEFKNNTTGTWGRGGGINVVEGNLTLNSGEFVQNTAAYGGGIYVNKGILNLNKGTIRENTATESGGGICAAENSEIHSSNKAGEVIIIDGNVAQKGHGGGIAVRGEITMNKLYLRNNKALSEVVNNAGLAMGCGGGIFVSGPDNGPDKNKIYLTLNSGDIENNQANMGGGIYVQNGSIATGQDEIVNVKNNTALRMGGGILLNSGNATMNEVHFQGNKASVREGVEGYGGGLFVYNGDLTLNSGDFTGNEADHGGGVYVRDGHIKTGTDITNVINIQQNKAYEDGGGIYLEGGDITLNTANIIENTANIIENTANIIENTATEHTLGNGGGICISSGTISINTGEIIGNKANNYGGGLYVYNPNNDTKTASFSGGLFYKNTANNAGGAVAIDGKIKLELSCTVDGNTAPCGGGVFMRNHATMTFKAGLIRNNKATGMPKNASTAFQLSADVLEGTGGGIFMGDNTTLDFDAGETTIGLYNNRADFAADDLFANMNNTTANLPKVANMNLRDYDVPTTRLYWVEDYPIGDTQYAKGTNLKQAGDTIRRYQESLRQMKEVYILDDAKLADYKNKYLCLALGYELVFLNLTKKGLAPYDDATFLFYYTNKKGEEVLYREVLVTGAPNGDPVSEIVVLPSGYWKVVESTWSSLYVSKPTFQPQPGPYTDPVTGEEVPAEYHLFDNKNHNYLQVINTQREIDIREAEHRKVNRIKPL